MRHAAGALLTLVTLAACRSTTNEPAPARASASASATASASPPVPEAFVPRFLDPPAAKGATAPNLVATGDGALLTWIEPAEKGGRVRLSRFTNGAWSPPVSVVESERLLVNWADVPAVAESAGSIFVAFPELTGKEGYRVELARSSDGGKTFERAGPIHTDTSETEHGFVAFQSSGDVLRAFWLDGRAMATGSNPAAATRLYGATLRGRGFVDEVLLDDRVCDCCGLAPASAAGGPIVAYRDRSEDEIRDISVVRAEGASFSAPIRATKDAFRIAGCPVNGPALAAEGHHAALAWYTYAGEVGRVKLAFSEDGGKSFGEPLEIAGPAGAEATLGRAAIALVSQGDAIVASVAAEREQARLFLRRASPQGSLGAPLLLASLRADRIGGFPKMVRLGDKLLLASMLTSNGGADAALRVVELPISAVPLPGTNATAPNAEPARKPKSSGEAAPALEVQTLAGEKATLASLKGKPALVNLWATYCEPCRFEIPVLVKLHERYKSRGLAVVGIAMDTQKTPRELEAFAKRRNVQYPIWIDPDDKAGHVLGVSILPATFLIDAEGKIVLARRGALREGDAELAAAIEKALGPAKK